MKPKPSNYVLAAALVATACLALSALAQETSPPTETEQPPTERTPPGDSSEQAPAQPPAPGGQGDQPVRTPAQPTAEDIIRRFQQELPEAVPVLPSGGEDEIMTRADAAGAGGRSRPRLPDGYMLTDRAGRLGQEGEWWIFIFEADNQSYPEPPMKLLPNQTLERMVRESRGGLDAVVFVISGEVTDFKSENYILPRKVLRKRDLGNLRK